MIHQCQLLSPRYVLFFFFAGAVTGGGKSRKLDAMESARSGQSLRLSGTLGVVVVVDRRGSYGEGDAESAAEVDG